MFFPDWKQSWISQWIGLVTTTTDRSVHQRSISMVNICFVIWNRKLSRHLNTQRSQQEIVCFQIPFFLCCLCVCMSGMAITSYCWQCPLPAWQHQPRWFGDETYCMTCPRLLCISAGFTQTCCSRRGQRAHSGPGGTTAAVWWLSSTLHFNTRRVDDKQMISSSSWFFLPKLMGSELIGLG